LVDLIYAENTQYIATCREGSARQNHNMKMGNKSFKIAEQFKYLERTQNINIPIVKNLSADEGRERLLSFGTKTFIFHFTI